LTRTHFKRWAIAIRRVFSTARTTIAGRPLASIAAGVQLVKEVMNAGASTGRDLQSRGIVWMIGWRSAGSLEKSALIPWTTSEAAMISPQSEELRYKLIPELYGFFLKLWSRKHRFARYDTDIWVAAGLLL
jgi:hypothetical protein